MVGTFCFLFLLLIAWVIYRQMAGINLTSQWVNKTNLQTLTEVVNAQGTILIAFDKDYDIFWTNNHNFFSVFFPKKTFINKPLKQFVPVSLFNQIVQSDKLQNQLFSIKNRGTGIREQFSASLIQDSILLLERKNKSFQLQNWIENNQPVFVLLQAKLDEFDETTSDTLIEAKRDQILAFVEIKLNAILTKYKPWLVRYGDNLFVLLLKNFYFQKLKQEKFTFLKPLSKEVQNQFRVNITFSGGVHEPRQNVFVDKKHYTVHPYEIENIYQNSTLALKMAIARFGDQIVLTKPDNTIQIFGKQTQKIRTLPQIKKNYQQFITKIKKYNNIFVFGHSKADFDVFGAGVGLKFLLDNFYPNKNIKFITYRPEMKTMTLTQKLLPKEILKQYFTKFKNLDAKLLTNKKTLFIIVDNNQIKKTDLPIKHRTLLKTSPISIIDHHVDNFSFEKFSNNPVFKLINNRFSSSSEIIAHFLMLAVAEKRELNIPLEIGQLILLGILIDTNNLQSNVGDYTFSVVDFLSQQTKVNVSQTQNWINELKNQLLPEKIESIAVHPRQIILKVFDSNANQENASNIAEEYLTKGVVDVVFVVAFNMERKIFVSARSKTDFNVQIVCKALGGGGGSKRAAAQLSNADSDQIIQKIKQEMLKIIDG